MPRDHARIQTAIWRNEEFRGLSRDAQHLYFVILSQPSLSYCGVMDWWPNRLAALSASGNESTVYAAASELLEAAFINLDPETSELAVRTYIRHDGVMQRVNMGKAVARALEKVTSLELVKGIRVEMARLLEAHPNLAGWEGFAELAEEDYGEILALAHQIRKGA